MNPDLMTKVNEIGNQIAILNKERVDALKSAEAHEEQARQDRKRATECKQQVGELTVVLNNLNVQRAVESAAEAAHKAKASAEAHEKAAADKLAELEKMRAELLELIAKNKTAEPTKE